MISWMTQFQLVSVTTFRSDASGAKCRSIAKASVTQSTAWLPAIMGLASFATLSEAASHYCSQQPMSAVTCNRTVQAGDSLRVRCFEGSAYVPPDFVVDPAATLLRFCKSKVTKVTDTCDSPTLIQLELPGTFSAGEESNFLVTTHKQMMRDALQGKSLKLYAVCGQNVASAMSLEIEFQSQTVYRAASSLSSILAFVVSLTFFVM